MPVIREVFSIVVAIPLVLVIAVSKTEIEGLSASEIDMVSITLDKLILVIRTINILAQISIGILRLFCFNVDDSLLCLAKHKRDYVESSLC